MVLNIFGYNRIIINDIREMNKLLNQLRAEKTKYITSAS